MSIKPALLSAQVALFLCLEYLIRVGDATSQLANVTLLLGKNPNESISGRCHRVAVIEGRTLSLWNLARLGINALFFLQADHCAEAYWNDVARAEVLLSMAYQADQ